MLVTNRWTLGYYWHLAIYSLITFDHVLSYSIIWNSWSCCLVLVTEPLSLSSLHSYSLLYLLYAFWVVSLGRRFTWAFLLWSSFNALSHSYLYRCLFNFLYVIITLFSLVLILLLAWVDWMCWRHLWRNRYLTDYVLSLSGFLACWVTGFILGWFSILVFYFVLLLATFYFIFLLLSRRAKTWTL